MSMRPSLVPAQAGFTLLEIVVVMALLSLVMLGLGASLRSFAGTEARIDARLEQVQEQRAVVHFLQTTAERLVAQRRSGAAVGENPFWFIGEAQALQWVGVMPPRFGGGGRHFFRLALESNGAGQQELVLRFAPWLPGGAFPDWGETQHRVLAGDVVALRLRYLDNRSEPPVWSESWTIPDRLPSRAELSLESSAMAWPDMVLALRELPSASSAAGGFSSGGGRQ